MASKIIGRLSMDEDSLQADLEAISRFPLLQEVYPEFGVGSWKNHSLWNKSGDYLDMQVQDSTTPAKVTALGAQLPYVSKILHESFDMTYLRSVRARNLVDGFVFPHKDFVELSMNKNHYLRVFVPLENNPCAYHSDEHSVFQMKKGEIWQLDASIVHAAANFSTNSRVHLCLDFQFHEEVPPLESIFLNQETTTDLAKPTTPTRAPFEGLDNLVNKLSKSISSETLFDMLAELAGIHFQHEVGVADCYDWLILAAEKSGREQIIHQCKKLKTFMIEHRSFNEQFSYQ